MITDSDSICIHITPMNEPPPLVAVNPCCVISVIYVWREVHSFRHFRV